MPLGVLAGSVPSTVTVSPAFLLRWHLADLTPLGAHTALPLLQSGGRQPSVQWVGSDAFLHVAWPVSSFPSPPSQGSMLIRRGMEAALSPKPSLGRRPQCRLPPGLIRVEQLCWFNKRQGGHLGSRSMKQPEMRKPGPCWGRHQPVTSCAIHGFCALLGCLLDVSSVDARWNA